MLAFSIRDPFVIIIYEMRDRMRKIYLIFLAVVLVGCSYHEDKIRSKQEDKLVLSTSTYITEEMKDEVMESRLQPSFAAGFDNMDLLYENCSDIVLAGVVSLDGADTIYPDGTKSVFGYTYGKFVVYDVLKGDLSVGNIYDYTRNGGIITQAQFDATRPAASLEKAERLREENGFDEDLTTQYINTVVDGDINIEAGKTYLIYLKADESNTFDIKGFMYGLREVSLPMSCELPLSISEDEMSDLMILDNVTGEFESYEVYLNNYINNHN